MRAASPATPEYDAAGVLAGSGSPAGTLRDRTAITAEEQALGVVLVLPGAHRRRQRAEPQRQRHAGPAQAGGRLQDRHELDALLRGQDPPRRLLPARRIRRLRRNDPAAYHHGHRLRAVSILYDDFSTEKHHFSIQIHSHFITHTINPKP